MTDARARPGSAGTPGLLALIREDVRCNRRSWAAPGAQALAAYRLGRWARDGRTPAARLARPFCRLLRAYVRARFDIDVSPDARIGRRVQIVHQGAIVIHDGVRLGDECMVRQQVRIGCFTRPAGADGAGPWIGDRVEFGARAVVDGPVRIGDRARIGPGAHVVADVPEDAAAIAPPSRVTRATPAAAQRADEPRGPALVAG